MTKADIKALMKGLEKRTNQDVLDLIEDIDEVSAVLTELEADETPTLRVPYVNANSLTTGTWK